MTSPSNYEQTIIETKVLLKTLTERVDRHSVEHSAGIERVYRELKEIRQISSEVRDEERAARAELEARVVKLETERNIGMKVIVPIISALFGAVSAWFTGLFQRGQ